MIKSRINETKKIITVATNTINTRNKYTFKSVMEKLKIIKNFLSSSLPPTSASPSDAPSKQPSPSASSNVPVSSHSNSESSSSSPTVQSLESLSSQSSPQTAHKTTASREEPPKSTTISISNFLSFSKANSTSRTPPLSNRVKKSNRPKFLRSKSSNIDRVKASTTSKTHANNTSFDSEPPTLAQSSSGHSNDTSSVYLTNQAIIDLIYANLDELIKFFRTDYEQFVNGNGTNRLTGDYFLETNDTSNVVYYQLASHARDVLKRSQLKYNEIEANAHKFDYEKLKSNGYRSVLTVYDTCVRRLVLIVHDLNEKKNRIVFLKFLNSSLKEFQSWLRLLEKLDIVLGTALDMQTTSLGEFRQTVLGENDVIPLRQAYEGPSLFLHEDKLTENGAIERNLFCLASEHLEAFFGKTCGFQFCESLQLAVTGCAIALASYNDGFEAYSPKESSPPAGTRAGSPNVTLTNSMSSASIQQQGKVMGGNPKSEPDLKNHESATNGQLVSSANLSNSGNSLSNTIGRAAMSFVSSTKYIMDPDSRAKKVSHVMKNGDVKFCKEFWQLTETSIVQVGSNLVIPKTAINVVKAINLNEELRLPRTSKSEFMSDKDNNNDQYVVIQPPSNIGLKETIKVRILSHELRKGMGGLDKFKSVENGVSSQNYHQSSLSNYTASLEPSRSLILHAHGGGFIAHSSRSHEVYLRPWCKELKVPIVSIDYSLAPEHAFPRASEECFFVYAWCLLNREALGWTGERIICVGDSAGGVLVTNIVQRAIVNQIRIPDALVPIYAPFLLTYSLSPSRLLSIMDPILNMGILWRCLAAYCGIDSKAETENYRNLLNLDPSSVGTVRKSNSRRLLSRLSRTDSKSEKDEENTITPDEEKKNSSVITETDTEKQRLLELHQIMGDSIFLIEKIKTNKSCRDPYMSPLLSDDQVVSKFPRTCLITTSYDPLLDDNIEFEKRLKHLNVRHNLVVFNNLNHGFLNFTGVSKDCRKASKLVVTHILKHILDDKEINTILYK